MAGGTFVSHNKIRPGAYINVKAQQRLANANAGRGKVATGLPMSWGDTITEITLTDLLSNAFFEKTGLRYTDDEALPLRILLENANTVYLYRLDETGVKAAASMVQDTTEIMQMTAKYPGVTGNKIVVAVATAEASGSYNVVTTVDGVKVDKQNVKKATELESTPWVDFDVVSDSNTQMVVGMYVLSGGVNGTVSATSYTNALAAFDKYMYNIVTFIDSLSLTTQEVIDKVVQLREQSGRYVKAVLQDVETANNEAVTSTISDQGIERTTNDISGTNKIYLPLYVAGLSSVQGPADSLTYFEVPMATGLEGELTAEEITAALLAGKFVFSRRTDGCVVVEDDRNTLVSVPQGSNKSLDWASNRVMRSLDEIITRVASAYEKSFIGKVTNDATGAALFASVVYDIFKEFESMGAIAPVDKANDIIIIPEDKNSMIASLAITVNDATEKLYVTVMVG